MLFSVTRDEARAALGLPDGRVVLYAPTWRDGDADPTVPSESEWSAIEAWLAARDTTLVVRPHPHGVGDYAAGVARCARVRMLTSATQPDITPVLPAFDALITDYSSTTCPTIADKTHTIANAAPCTYNAKPKPQSVPLHPQFINNHPDLG